MTLFNLPNFAFPCHFSPFSLSSGSVSAFSRYDPSPINHVLVHIILDKMFTFDVVEAHAMALNWTGTLLSNHLAREYIAVRRFELLGLRQSQSMLHWITLILTELPASFEHSMEHAYVFLLNYVSLELWQMAVVIRFYVLTQTRVIISMKMLHTAYGPLRAHCLKWFSCLLCPLQVQTFAVPHSPSEVHVLVVSNKSSTDGFMTANLSWNDPGPCSDNCNFTLLFKMSAVSFGNHYIYRLGS